jgi:hypothetical protein
MSFPSDERKMHDDLPRQAPDKTQRGKWHREKDLRHTPSQLEQQASGHILLVRWVELSLDICRCGEAHAAEGERLR